MHLIHLKGWYTEVHAINIPTLIWPMYYRIKGTSPPLSWIITYINAVHRCIILEMSTTHCWIILSFLLIKSLSSLFTLQQSPVSSILYLLLLVVSWIKPYFNFCFIFFQFWSIATASIDWIPNLPISLFTIFNFMWSVNFTIYLLFWTPHPTNSNIVTKQSKKNLSETWSKDI